MSELQCGIVGLPNVGKSTLFNALTKIKADVANYPFCTIEPNVGIVNVPDERLSALAKLSHSKRCVYATTKFVDIAGLVAGAHQGEGLGNQFLSHIRQVDTICHVVRCFDAKNISHVCGKVDPIADIEIIQTELILADLQMCENILFNLTKKGKADSQRQRTKALLDKVQKQLADGQPLRLLARSEEEGQLLRLYPFLTEKKMLYVANVGEGDLLTLDHPSIQQLGAYAKQEGAIVVPMCAKIEEEIGELEEEEAKEFLHSLGLNQPGVQRLVQASYQLLDLLSYFTTGELESRAWTISRGMRAAQAAGVIHSDFERAFIRAEVVTFEQLQRFGSWAKAKEAGLMRLEGKEYVVQDGDVIFFRTAVA